MSEDTPNRDLVERAEDLILRLREVRSARIYTDEEGGITEIHVVAATERAPKLIARDVETALKASLGVSIDYRKIGVVVLDPAKEVSSPDRGHFGATHPGDTPERRAEEAEPPVDLRELLAEPGEEPPVEAAAGGAGAEAPPAPRGAGAQPGLEFLEEDARLRFRSLSLSIEEGRVEAEVKLEKNGLVVAGVVSGPRGGRGNIECAAMAAVDAVQELLDEKVRLTLGSAVEVAIDGRAAVCAVVHVSDGRRVTSYAGAVLCGDDRGEAAALAVLDALNRPLGRWKLRREIHYRIV